MFSRDKLLLVTAVALSLSIGWGIRGNFGHETGAMIPGALAALAAVILSGRNDWYGRAGSFGFFGALGWSFGGSISYMQVIGYTHSGHSLSVLYGFACLFLIGFLWAIFGGVGTALPACLDADSLRSLFSLVFVIFAAWWVQDLLVNRLVQVDSAFRHTDPLYWYDTDWLGVTVALGATLLCAAFRRRFDFGVKLALALGVGWWCGFAGFVLLLGWRMTPPRGDNWAGCLGMAVALCLFLARQRMRLLLYSGLLCGTIGGVGFAFANCLKLMGISTGWQTNWHSLLEQSYGLINGIGIAAVMLVLRKHAAPQERPNVSSERIAVFFLLVVVTFVNLQKNVPRWVKASTVPSEMYGLSAEAWFMLAYAAAGLLFAYILFSKNLSELRAVPAAGRSQLIYLVFLWWIVMGNFERALAGFTAERLVTEGIIFLNALICTGLVLGRGALVEDESVSFSPVWRRVAGQMAGTILAVTLFCWGAIRLTQGDGQIGYASRHIRFGPDANATGEKPLPGRPHP